MIITAMSVHRFATAAVPLRRSLPAAPISAGRACSLPLSLSDALRISCRADLSRHKQRNQELEKQLEADHETIAEYERQQAEYQEKNVRLQRRLTHADQRATAVTQQMSMLTSQRRKTPAISDLETA